MDFFKGMTKKVVSLFVLLGLFAINSQTAFAQMTGHCDISIADKNGTTIVPRTSNHSISFPNSSSTIKISYYFDPSFVKNVTDYQVYGLVAGFGQQKGIDQSSGLFRYEQDINVSPDILDASLTKYQYDAHLRVNNNGTWTSDYCAPVTLNRETSAGNTTESCDFGKLTVSPKNVSFTLDGTKLKPTSKYELLFSDPSLFKNPNANFVGKSIFDGGSNISFNIANSAVPGDKQYSFSVVGSAGGSTLCSTSFSVGTTTTTKDSSGPTSIPPAFNFCNQANSSDRELCSACYSKGQLWTALGCIPTDTQGIVQSLLTVGLGLSGGVVLLSIIIGAFMMATSAGEPKKVQEAQEMISAAIIGLLFVIFSVIILNFVGVNILHIPGFA